MKAKYIVLIGLFAATMVACSRDEESLFEKPAAIRAQEAVDSAIAVLTGQEAWEMAYFPNLEATAKGYNMIVKFSKNSRVSVTAKNSLTTNNKITTDANSTWVVKSDYGPILSFDTYNEVLHAFSDPAPDGAGHLGDYEFLILKATPDVVVLKGKKHSAYTVLRPLTNPSDSAYFANSEKMMTKLFGNNNIVTLDQNGQKKYLFNGVSGQFMSSEYGSVLVNELATTHPVCATEDGIIVSVGFGENVHEHIFYYDSIKGELTGEAGTVMNSGNLNLLFRSYFTDNAFGWSVDPTNMDAANELLTAINTAMNNTSAKMKVLGYGYKQSLNMYEGGYFLLVNFTYKQGKKNQEKKLVWTIDLTADDNGITVANAVPYDKNTETFLGQIPVAQSVADAMLGSFKAVPSETNLFNGAAGMYLEGTTKLAIKGATNVKM